MIKTSTTSAKQGSAKEAEYTGETSAAARAQSARKANQDTAKEEYARIMQTYSDAGEVMSAENIQEELKEINQRLKAWQDRVDELLNDPNNADKIVNLLNSIQYMINRKAELNILQRQFVNSSKDEYTFQDNQSILHAGSVRRKDAEALKIVERNR